MFLAAKVVIRGSCTVIGVPSFRGLLLRRAIGSAGIQVLNRVLTLVLGVILARTLGADGYGIYALIYAVMTLLMLAAEAGAPTLVMREVAKNNHAGGWGGMRGAVVRSTQFVVASSITVSLISLGILLVIADNLEAEALRTAYLMLLLLPFVAVGKTIGYILRGLNFVSTGQIVELLLRPALVLAIVSIVFLLSSDLRQPQYVMATHLAAAVVVVTVSGIILFRNLPRGIYAAISTLRCRTWMRSALPFALIGGAAVINNQADLIMIGWYETSEEVGAYRVAVQGATLVAVSLQAVNAVVAPQFASLFTKGDMVKLQRLVTTATRGTTIAALPIAITLVVFGGDIVVWAIGAEFSSSYRALAILSVGQLVNAAMGSVGFLLNMTGHEKDTARILWYTAMLNIVLNAVLIPILGTSGAAIASIISLSTWNFCLFLIARRRLGINTFVVN